MFSLKQLFLVVGIAGVLLFFFSEHRNRQRRLNEFKKRFSAVENERRSFSVSPKGSISKEDIQLLRQFADRIAFLNLSGKDLRSIDPEFLSDLVNLYALSLDHSRFSKPFLNHLSDAKKLEWLSLGNTGLENDDLSTIKNFPNLRELDLGYNALSYRPVKELILSLKRLNQIELSGTGLSESDVKYIESLKDCRISFNLPLHAYLE